jgi:polyadenylate-binding protein
MINLCLTVHLTLQADKLFLYEKFGPFGAVLSVKVLANEQGRCKGVGFVNFGDADAAARAVQHMNGAAIGDRRLFVALQTHRSR